MKNNRFYLYLVLLAIIPTLLISDCAVIDPLRDLFRPKTEREVYAREWRRRAGKDNATYQAWIAENDRAIRNALQTNIPQRELVQDAAAEQLPPGLANAYSINLPRGRGLKVQCNNKNGAKVYGELYRVGRDGQGQYYDLLSSWTSDEPTLYFEDLEQGGELALVVQTGPEKGGYYELIIEEYAPLQFPVEGRDNAAIQSFWGAPRDGGARSHEGNDIFAPKGTPVLATSDGRITRVENKGIGGKTVWLEDKNRGLRMYYAHLDEQWVRPNQYVTRGEALGSVGNTGNARTTPAHLHFGIYPTGEGAVDPLPYYQLSTTTSNNLGIPLDLLGQPWTVDRVEPYYLRLGPQEGAASERQLRAGEGVWILGVCNGRYRIRTETGESGYFVP